MKINDSMDLFVNFENDFNEEFFGILNHQWGVDNGGCVEDNVSIKENSLVLDACGNLYDGPIKGLNHDKTKADNGKKTGAGIISKNYFGPGSFEVLMKPCLNFGACSAFWTWYGDGELNHEIDIELPGHKEDKIPSFELMLNNTWKVESKHEKNCTLIKNANDGEYHKFRFDWHTEPARVEFYYDDELVCVNTTEVPTIKSNVFIAVWFPNGWAGEPNFEKEDMRVKYFKYHPFLEKCEDNKIDIFTDMTNKIAS